MNEIKKILFSPIGGSDPINAGYDGSWLHCCRNIQPDLTMIYLSANMTEYEEKDHRFSRALMKLEAFTGHTIKLRQVLRPELIDPHLFDPFYDDFETLLANLHQEFPDAELWVNVSSGTTAMKNCLVSLFHTLPFRVHLVQVDGPYNEMFSAGGDRTTASSPNYNLDEAWESNLDNLEDAKNRCHPMTDEQQELRLQVKQIITLVEHNEYYAAALLADKLGAFLPADARDCLHAAADRQQLCRYAAGTVLYQNGFPDGKLLLRKDNELLYQGAEMTLTMQCDLERNDIAGCVRKLTPVLFSLIVSYLKYLGIDVMQFCDKDFRFDAVMMKKAYPDLYNAVSQNTDLTKKLYVSHSFLINILDYSTIVSDKKQLCPTFKMLRNLEGGVNGAPGVRNEVAHKPVKMTERDFLQKSGNRTTPKDMMQAIRSIFERLEPQMFTHAFWNSYKTMNEFLVKKLQRI